MIKYITPVRPEAADGLVRDVYRQIKVDFGAVVEPFACHSVLPRLMAAVWAAFRESLLVGSVPREIKEAIAVSVSQSNRCPFCVDAHVIMLHAVKAHSAACALVSNRPERLTERMQTVTSWARETGHNGSPNRPVPAAEFEAPEIIGTVVFFHYINRVCAALLDNTPLPSSRPWLKPFLSRSAGWYFSIAARRPKPPGASLAFLPDAPLPADMGWAAANPTLARAWARLAHEVDQQGRMTIPAETLSFAADYIDNRNESIHSSPAAMDEAVEQLGGGQRSVARFILLLALAPHEVDEQVIRDFVNPSEEPERFLGAIAWASFAAARRIGSSFEIPSHRFSRQASI